MGQLKLVEVKEARKESRNLIKERALEYGVNTLFNSEALSLLTGVRKEVLEKFNSLRQVKEELPLLSLSKVQRIKLEAFFSMATRFSKESRGEIKKITGPSDVSNLLMEDMRHLKKEHFIIVILDTKNQVIKTETISIGSLNASIVHPREVFKEALLSSASAIILCHNHPSGQPDPSVEDIKISKRLQEVGNLMGIQVLDHIIFGDGNFKSLKEDGHM